MPIELSRIVAVSCIAMGTIAGCSAGDLPEDFADGAQRHTTDPDVPDNEATPVDGEIDDLQQPLMGQSCGGRLGLPCPPGQLCSADPECVPTDFLGCEGTCVAPPSTDPCAVVLCRQGFVCEAIGRIPRCVPRGLGF